MIAHNSRIKRNCDYTQLIKVTRHLRIFLMQQISGGESLSTNRATEVALYSRKLDYRF